MLTLSTKYALKVLLHLARNSNDDYVQVKVLSKEANVPGPYLSKIIKQLAAKNLVDTRRGIAGGVRLPLKGKPITFYDVCLALEDPIVSQSCFLSKSVCSSVKHCVMHNHWSRFKGELAKFLQSSKIN